MQRMDKQYADLKEKVSFRCFGSIVLDQMSWVLTAIHWHLMATSLTVFSGNIAAILIYFMIPDTLAYLTNFTTSAHNDS